jgi:hypothetical protein
MSSSIVALSPITMPRPEFFEPLVLSPIPFAGSPVSTLTNVELEPHDDAAARLFEDFAPILPMHEFDVMQFVHEEEEDDAWVEYAEAEPVYDDEEDEENYCFSCGYALVTGERLCCTDCRQQMRPEERIWLF